MPPRDLQKNFDFFENTPCIFSKDVIVYIRCPMKQRADIAQQVERILGKDEVPGSNPGISSRSLAEMQDFFVVIR